MQTLQLRSISLATSMAIGKCKDNPLSLMKKCTAYDIQCTGYDIKIGEK